MTARSLFARVIWLQLLTSVCVILLIGAFFYVERNVTVARLLAEHWAPALRQAAGGDMASAAMPLKKLDELPSGVAPVPGISPRIAALRSALEDNGVPVQALAFETERGRFTIWVGVARAGGRPGWIGFEDRRLVEPNIGWRLLLATAFGLLLVAGASWRFARRLTLPLAELRQRMAAHRPGAGEGLATAEPPLSEQVGAEVLAIDSTWRDMRERLSRYERERSLLLAGVSHDLRGPLTRIRLAAALLPDDASVAPRRDLIVRNVQTADRLIDDFLDHARFAQLPLNEPVDLSAIAQRLALEHAGLEVQAPPTLRLPRAHVRLVERMLGNLVENAFKHGRPPVRLSLQHRAGDVIVEVADAGDGIPAALQASMLHAFARGDASRGSPGSGLGLAIVGQGAERLGGRIVFDLPGTGGFVVRLVLPAS